MVHHAVLHWSGLSHAGDDMLRLYVHRRVPDQVVLLFETGCVASIMIGRYSELEHGFLLCREGLRDLHAFAAIAMATVADDIASSLHDIPIHLGLTAEAQVPASSSSSSEDAEERESGEGEASDPASEELQQQLSALRGECREAQRLKDHWHSQYTAQVSCHMRKISCL